MPISILYTENARQGTDKINQIFGIESGALSDPWELTFNIARRIRTLVVDEDIELALASTGKVSYTEEILVVTGDESHALTFPADWVISGDAYNPFKVHRIIFLYDGTYVEGVISILGDIPDIVAPTLSSSTMNGVDGGAQTLDLVFSEAVNITTAGWSLSASGGAVTVSSVASGSGTTTPKFSLSRNIAGSETITISYDTSTGNTLDLAGNELATVSASSVTNNVYTINLDVPFTGTTIDTGKGTVTNPDSANLTISQNGKLIFKRTTDTNVASALGNFWRSVNTYTRGTFAVLTNIDTGFSVSTAQFMYRVDANNDIAIIKETAGSIVVLRIRSGGSTVYTLTTAISANNRFRIRYDSSHNIIFEYWNVSAWVQMGTTQTFNIGAAGNVQCCTNSHSSDAANDQFSFDAIYVTDKVYPTVTP